MGTLLSVLEAGRATDPAIVVPDGPQLSYRDLREQVARTADRFAALGVERGDRVAMVLPNGAEAVAQLVAPYALGPEDVSLCVVPLFHVHGLMASALATLASGGTLVTPARFNPLSFWSLVKAQRATWYSAVPTIHQLALARTG